MIRPLTLALLLASAAWSAEAQELLIRNATVHTVTGRGTLERTDVLVRGGRIAAVGGGLVAPGATVTPILDNVTKEHISAIQAGIPKGKLGEVDQIVPSYVFLAADENNHYVGQTISPNGGDVFL